MAMTHLLIKLFRIDSQLEYEYRSTKKESEELFRPCWAWRLSMVNVQFKPTSNAVLTLDVGLELVILFMKATRILKEGLNIWVIFTSFLRPFKKTRRTMGTSAAGGRVGGRAVERAASTGFPLSNSKSFHQVSNQIHSGTPELWPFNGLNYGFRSLCQRVLSCIYQTWWICFGNNISTKFYY